MDDETREALLLTVLDHYGYPEPGWGERAMKCPVHDDAHASASVNRSKGLFNCHACGASGTGIDIVMGREQLDYPSAVQFVQQLGASVETTKSRTRPNRRRDPRWKPPRLRRAG